MYKLINKQTGEEHICQKVVIDRMDYYVSDVHAVSGDFALYAGHITKKMMDTEWTTGDKKVIATNNPNIDIPKIVSSASLGLMCANNSLLLSSHKFDHLSVFYGFEKGYNKSQETHPNSDENMIEFNEFSIGLLHKQVNSVRYYDYDAKWITTKELLQIWKEQKPKIVYYG